MLLKNKVSARSDKPGEFAKAAKVPQTPITTVVEHGVRYQILSEYKPGDKIFFVAMLHSSRGFSKKVGKITTFYSSNLKTLEEARQLGRRFFELFDKDPTNGTSMELEVAILYVDEEDQFPTDGEILEWFKESRDDIPATLGGQRGKTNRGSTQ